MYISKANDIYEDFQKKKITREKAITLLMEEIFHLPYFYGLADLDDDERIDFLIWSHKSIKSILEKYKSSESSFLTYFTISIRFQGKTWRRQNAKTKTKQRVLDMHSWEEHKLTVDKDEMYVEESPEPYRTAKQRESTKQTLLSNKQKRFLLVLSLKNYPFLTAKHIERIPALADINEEQFHEYLKKIHESIDKSMARYLDINYKLNKTFVSLNQYIEELKNMDPQTTQYALVHTNLEKEKNRLEYRRKQFNLCTHRLMPRNSTIEKTLDYPPGSVSKILKQAEENINGIIEILDREDA